MLPSAGYFKSVLCPFFEDNRDCPRSYCHYKHIKKEKNTITKPSSSSAQNGLSYKATPLALLGQDAQESEEEVPTYNPTPIVDSAIVKSEPKDQFENEKIDQLWQQIEAPTNGKNIKKEIKSEKSKEKKTSEDSKRSSHSKDGKESKRSSESKESRSSSSSSRSSKHKDHKSSRDRDKEKKDRDKEKKERDHSSDSKSRHKDDHKRSKDRKRSSSDKDSDRDSKRSKDDHKKRKTSSEKSSKNESNDLNNGEEEDDVPDSVLSFLDMMDEIDAKNSEKKAKDSPNSSPKKSHEHKSTKKSSSGEAPSFLAAISKPDKLLKPKDPPKKSPSTEIDPRAKSRIRISSVKPSDSGMSSAMIARKKQPNNPVNAMLQRFNKVRVESQTKDLENQLSALTGEELPSTSTSSESFDPSKHLLEGLRKGKTKRVAHTVTNTAFLRRPVIDSESQSKVPVNVRQVC